MSDPRQPRVGFFPFKDGGIETFIRRDLFVRMCSLARVTFLCRGPALQPLRERGGCCALARLAHCPIAHRRCAVAPCYGRDADLPSRCEWVPLLMWINVGRAGAGAPTRFIQSGRFHINAFKKTEAISHRKVFSLAGFAAAFGLAVPTLLTVSMRKPRPLVWSGVRIGPKRVRIDAHKQTSNCDA